MRWQSRWLTAVAIGTLLLAIGAALSLNAFEIQGSPLQQPGYDHILGTDFLGRDVAARILYGSVDTIGFAAMSTLTALAGGVLLAGAQNQQVSWLRFAAQSLVTALLAIPSILLALVLLTAAGEGRVQVALATGLALVGSESYFFGIVARQVRTSEFVTAAYSLGARDSRIWIHHVIPMLMPVLIQRALIVFSYALISNATLNVLGLGGDPSRPEWGAMLAEGRFNLRDAPWLVMAPGVALILLVLAVNTAARMLEQRLARNQ